MFKPTNQTNKVRIGNCESCTNTDSQNTLIESAKGRWIWMCDTCRDKELAILTEKNKQAITGLMNQTNLPINSLNTNEIKSSLGVALQTSRDIDSSIQVRTDLFNAETVAIVELAKTINSDETIQNKPYALAEELMKRFTHHKEVIFQKSAEIVELNNQLITHSNQQKAIQVYLNQLTNSLRQEEREKLKIADINYKPTPPKAVKPKTIKTSGTKKLDKTELRKYASKLGISEFTLQQIVVAKGVTVAEAAVIIRNSIAAAKSQ